MVKVDMSQFAPVVLETGLHLRSGGRLPKSCPIKTKEISTADHTKPDIYCHFHTRMPWVCGAVLGYKGVGVGSGRTTLIHTLREKIEGIATCNDEEAIAEEERLDDPMEQMEILVAARPRARKRKIKNEARTVRMPEFPPGADQGERYKDVRLYIVDKKQMWLHKDDVPWALRYLFMEHSLKIQELHGREAADSHGDMSPDQGSEAMSDW